VKNGGKDYAIGDTVTLAGGTKYHEPELKVQSINSGDYASNAVVSAGGTGYVVGDILLVAGGTYSVQCEVEVTAVSGGVVTTVQINNPGIYSAQPSNPASTTGGTGSGCTLTMSWTAGTGIITGVHISDSGVYTAQATNPVSQNTSSGSGTGAKFTVTYTDTAWVTKVDIEVDEATGVSISAAGTGYTAGDIVTVVGGSFMEAATVEIDSVSAGVPTAVSVNTSGQYKTTPSNPASTSGGTGSGLTLTVTWSTHANLLKYLFLQNSNSSLNIGWRGVYYAGAEDAYWIESVGFTGFTSELTPWDEQPGFASQYYGRTPLSGGASPATINYWLSISDQRITGAFKVGTAYPNLYVGLLDPYLTTDEYSHPMLSLGCMTGSVPYTYSGAGYSGMNNPAAYDSSGREQGPGVLRLPDGTTLSVVNWYDNSGSPTVDTTHIGILPGWNNAFPAPSGAGGWYSSAAQRFWPEMFKESLSIDSNQDALGRIGSQYVLIPCSLISEAEGRAYGSLRGVFALNPDNDVISEDTVTIGTDVYRVFSNCNKSNRNYFFAIKEE